MAPPGGLKWWEQWAPWLNTNVPGFNKIMRFLVAAGAEYDWRLFGSEDYHAKERAKLETKLLKHMKKTVPEKYHKVLTPDYGVGCKRRIFDATWFPGLNDPGIELTTLPLTSVSSNSVTLGPGRTYPAPEKQQNLGPDELTVPADVIVLANGFQTTQWLHPLEITGRHGKKIHDVWEERGGPQMYMGVAMDGFPNFFTIFGPNTATGHSSVILASENMVNLALKFIKPVLDGAVERVEIKKEAELGWANDIQGALRKRVWNTGGCRSWYQTEEGWNSTVYPYVCFLPHLFRLFNNDRYSQINFTLRCMFPTWKDWDITYTPKGLAIRRVKKLFKSLAVMALFIWLYNIRKNRQTARMMLKDIARDLLQGSGQFLQSLAGKV